MTKLVYYKCNLCGKVRPIDEILGLSVIADEHFQIADARQTVRHLCLRCVKGVDGLIGTGGEHIREMMKEMEANNDN